MVQRTENFSIINFNQNNTTNTAHKISLINDFTLINTTSMMSEEDHWQLYQINCHI